MVEDNKPLGVFGTVQMGLRLWLRHALDATLIALIIGLPGFILRQLLYHSAGIDPTQSGQGSAYGYISIIEYPLTFWGCLGLALLFAAGYCGERASAWQALNQAKYRFIPFSLALLGPSLITGMLIAPLMFLAVSTTGLLALPISVIVVGIVLFAVCLLFIISPIATVENIGPIACIKRAFDETRWNMGYLVSVLIAFTFAAFLLLMVIMMIFFGDVATIDENGALESINIPSMFFLQLLITIILVPWSMATSVAAYVSLRQRKTPEYSIATLRTEIGLG